jgi:predicted lipoprotein with Yx(FWY)xxD motif
MIDFRRRQVPTRLLVAVVVVAAAGFAAIGATARTVSPTTTIGSRHTKAGVILVGPRGQTLYLFSHGPNGPSSCYGRCARNWPPLRAFGRPVAMPGSGVKQRWLSTTRRRDGILQVTYDGHPLYVNGGDTKPGSLKGDHTQEFGGRWYVVPISGVKGRRA